MYKYKYKLNKVCNHFENYAQNVYHFKVISRDVIRISSFILKRQLYNIFSSLIDLNYIHIHMRSSTHSHLKYSKLRLAATSIIVKLAGQKQYFSDLALAKCVVVLVVGLC